MWNAHALDDKSKRLKEKGEQAFVKQKWDKAFDCYKELVKIAPSNVRFSQRLADVAYRLSDLTTAVEYYKKAAQTYVSQGYWAKALAVAKVLVQINPEDTEFLARLAKRSSVAEDARKATRPKPSLDILGDFIELAEPTGSIEAIPLFAEMDTALTHAVLEKLHRQVFSKGTHICRQGDPAGSMFVLAEGKVQVSAEKDGQTLVLAQLCGGDFFGEYSLVSGQPRSAHVVALTEVEALEISRSDLDRIAAQYPHIWNILEDHVNWRMIDTHMAQSPSLSLLSSEERRELAKAMELRKFERGQVIMEEGSKGLEMYFLKKGRVTVTQLQHHKKVVLADLGLGHYFGEMSMLTGSPRTASVIALEDCEAFVLTRQQAAPVLKRNLHVLEQFKQEIQKKKDEISEVAAALEEAHGSLFALV